MKVKSRPASRQCETLTKKKNKNKIKGGSENKDRTCPAGGIKLQNKAGNNYNSPSPAKKKENNKRIMPCSEAELTQINYESGVFSFEFAEPFFFLSCITHLIRAKNKSSGNGSVNRNQ